MANKNTESFKENYVILKEVSEAIRNQENPDIDALVPLVDKGLAAYAKCKERIEAVKMILGEKLPADS